MTDTPARFAFVKAQWHADIVDRAYDGFAEGTPDAQTDVFDVPGAFELPLKAQQLARTFKAHSATESQMRYAGAYREIAVDVAAAVVDGLMRVGLDTGVPVLSVSLTPHHYQETDHHNAIYRAHFVEKGREAARAALALGQR